MDLRKTPCPKCGKRRLKHSFYPYHVWCRACKKGSTWQEVDMVLRPCSGSLGFEKPRKQKGEG